MKARRRITAGLRVRVYDANAGVCHICGLHIDAPKKQWHVEHRKPLWLGGKDDESNMAPAHDHCHVEKTASEAPIRAKGTRVRARHLGVKRTAKGRSFQTNRDGPFKKKVSGEVVRR